MKIVTAIDSFKGSLSSVEAGQAAGEGVLRVYPDCEVVIRPIADGGEGTVDAWIEGLGGERVTVSVTGPLGDKVDARYGIVDGKTAIMEMSAAAGITLVPEEKRNPMLTTTYGVGEMIRDAINNGCTNFVIGIGGSATNDGGIGMLQALGFDILDSEGSAVGYGGMGLKKIAAITNVNVLPEVMSCTFNIACDVNNPLCGDLGCSAVYGPQKGADQEMIRDMDSWLLNYAELSKNVNPKADKEAPGSGAAGGLGFAFRTFLNGTLKPGIELILEETMLEEHIKGADLVITGEGRLDAQTAMGKAPSGVAKIAKKYSLPVLAFSGAVTKDATECNKNGIDAFFPVLRKVCALDEAMDKDNAYQNVSDTVEQVFRVIKTFKGE